MNQLKKSVIILSLFLMAALPCYADGLSGLIYVFYAGLVLAGIYLLSIILCIAFYKRLEEKRVPFSLKLVTWILLAINVFVATIAQDWGREFYLGGGLLWLMPLMQVSLIISETLSKPLSHRAHILLHGLRTFLIAYLAGKMAWALMFSINELILPEIAFQLPLTIVLIYYAYSIYKYLVVVQRRYPEYFSRKYCVSYALWFVNICMLTSIYLIPIFWEWIMDIFRVSGSMMMVDYNPVYFICVFSISNLVAYLGGVNAYKRISEEFLKE